MSTVTCPQCGEQNRREARFCQRCQADLSPTRDVLPAVPDQAAPPPPPAGRLSGLVRAVRRRVMGGQSASPPRQPPSTPATRRLRETEEPTASQPVASPQPAPATAPQILHRLTPLQRGSVLTHPQDPRRRYGIAVARELDRSIYYDAVDLTCPACRSPQPDVPSDGLCRQCRVPLRPVLVHERRPRANGRLSDADVQQLLYVSAGHPSILPHLDILQYQDNVYTVVEHPGRWGVLVRGRQQRSSDEALAGAVQVGQALAYLYERGFVHSEVGGVSIESVVLVGGEGSARLADLSTCVRRQPDDAQALRAQVNRDVAFLAQLLFYLSTGKELSRASLDAAPPTLRPFIERAMQGQYTAVQDMLTDFSSLPSAPMPGRSLKPAHGQATHPGHKYTRNEDAVVTFTFDKEQDGRSVPIGFYLVADGMGGHDAGDVASRAVNRIVTDWVLKTTVLPDLRKTTRKLTTENVPAELLTQAIQQANEVLLHHGQAKGSDLGSTVAAALIIGDVATVANVGDSRTYLLRDGRLAQITQDHSLVARLVDAGVIKPAEVRAHPQRNQIYRCLGHKPSVVVDTFTVQLQRGDRLVLCSDGLWEMVLDPEMQRIVESSRSPQQACDALVEAANRAGGEDNIAVIVVGLE